MAPWVTSRGPRQAHLEDFDLHADIAVAADDRVGLERLTRYVLRPPVTQDRLHVTPDGQVLITLKAAWADGTTHLLFEPVEFLEKLAALTPRPRINLLLYHGILAPHARDRARAVAHGAVARAAGPAVAPPAGDPAGSAPDPTPAPPVVSTSTGAQEEPCGDSSQTEVTAGSGHHWTCARLMQRVFDLDLLACPRCEGRMSMIATIEAKDVVQKILGHLGLPTDVPEPRPGWAFGKLYPLMGAMLSRRPRRK